MVFDKVCDRLSFKTLLEKFVWAQYNQHGAIVDKSACHQYASLLRKNLPNEDLLNKFNLNYEAKLQSLIHKNEMKGEPFELYMPIHPDDVPANRKPAPGIRLINARYHVTKPVYATEKVPETGFPPMTGVTFVVNEFYPQYKSILEQYVRPLGTTDATFADFNREQIASAPIQEERKQQVLTLVKFFLNSRPYRPLHYTELLFAKLPFHTGTSYFARYHYKTRIHANYARPNVYRNRPTSKGYFLNSQWALNRTHIHNMKHFHHPQNTSKMTEQQIEDLGCHFYLSHPTMLFTRNHISTVEDDLKQRPVYAVDTMMLNIETMLTLPLLTQARDDTCCIMYGLETIRGGCHKIDSVAQRFESFFCYDWRSFDQRAPRRITDIYYTDFLESQIIIDQGYQTSALEERVIDPPAVFFSKMSNLLQQLHEIYNNMVFLTADGYAYQRTHAGVPSGLFNTQYLDSFCNLFILLDGLLEYGYSDQQIRSIVLYIMGDDNTGLTQFSYYDLVTFTNFFEHYSLKRYNMVLNRRKSIITPLRNLIEILSYTVNFGLPKRPISKLVAQLCFPEHDPIPQYMSYRAIGIAYAAAGQDPEFHNFCRDIYISFKSYAVELTPDTQEKLEKHLPGLFNALDPVDKTLDFSHFPTLHEVIKVYSTYHGPLDYHPKWDKAHFFTPPFFEGTEYETILSYRTKHNIPRVPIKSYDLNAYLQKNNSAPTFSDK